MTDYVKVNTVSIFRQTYVIPLDSLQEENTDVELTHKLAEEWANDAVTCENVEEFSQKWMGENIITTDILSEEEILKQFDKDNPELITEWDDQRKLSFINSWKVKTIEKPNG